MEARAQVSQMQCRLRCASGTRANNAGLNVSLLHQQGVAAWPLAAMLQALGLPHRGHKLGEGQTTFMPSA